MKSLAGIIFLAFTLTVQSVQLSEEAMDQVIKPCIVYNVNCPSDGSMGNYNEMKKELEKMKVGIALMGGRKPYECGCEGGEQCDRECYYALMKVAVLELKVGGGNQQVQERLEKKRKRHDKRSVFKVSHPEEKPKKN